MDQMKAQTVIIRQAVLEDAVLISELSSSTFYETFSEVNTKEDMDKYLSEKFSLAVVKEELLDAKTIFFIASANNTPIGYTKLRYNKTPEALTGIKAIEIERLYVCRTHQGLKIGAALMQQNIEYAKQDQYKVIWLGVWEQNPKAIEFYKRRGFDIFGKHIFRLGNDDQNDLLMKKNLI